MDKFPWVPYRIQTDSQAATLTDGTGNTPGINYRITHEHNAGVTYEVVIQNAQAGANYAPQQTDDFYIKKNGVAMYAGDNTNRMAVVEAFSEATDGETWLSIDAGVEIQWPTDSDDTSFAGDETYSFTVPSLADLQRLRHYNGMLNTHIIIPM